LPDGYSLQVYVRQSNTLPIASLRNCTSDRANEISCPTPTLGMGDSPRYSVKAMNADDVSQAVLPASGAVALLGPSGPDGRSRMVIIASHSDQVLQVAWDGSTVSIAAPDSYAASLQSAHSASDYRSVAVDCSASEPTLGPLECPIAADPPLELDVTAFRRAPSGTYQLRYSDESGTGTMTIANVGQDAMPGGAAIDVSLVQTDVTLSGSGVMRPIPQPVGFLLAFELSDDAGNSYLFQTQITGDGSSYSGRGLWLDEADETQAGSWTVGTPSTPTRPYSAGTISLGPHPYIPGTPASPGSPPGPGTQQVTPATPPSPGIPLPSYAGAEPIDATGQFPTTLAPGLAPPPLYAPGQVPVIGAVGQALTLLAVTTFPCCGPGASQTWDWSFGDGTASGPNGTQTVTHAWSEPGTYVIAVVLTDETGVRTFALTQIQVAP
jgi:hypothetical protein